jgi:pyruvate ferredoxin oxidoreductase delta subunit
MKKKQKPELFGQADDQIKLDPKKIPVLSASISEPASVGRVLKPKIELKICQNNYNCIVFCPHNAIFKNEKGRPQINYDLCTGCLICLRECPTNAISEEREVT